jgi:Flp pilus assembly protein TadD
MLPDAVSELREALRLDPEYVKAWNDLGVVMESLGNCSEAMQCYGQALQLDPTHIEARTNLMALTIQIDLARALRHQADLALVMQ